MESLGDCVKDLFQFPEPKHTSLVKAVMHRSVEKNQGMSRNHSVVLPFAFFFGAFRISTDCKSWSWGLPVNLVPATSLCSGKVTIHTLYFACQCLLNHHVYTKVIHSMFSVSLNAQIIQTWFPALIFSTVLVE